MKVQPKPFRIGDGRATRRRFPIDSCFLGGVSKSSCLARQGSHYPGPNIMGRGMPLRAKRLAACRIILSGRDFFTPWTIHNPAGSYPNACKIQMACLSEKSWEKACGRYGS